MGIFHRSTITPTKAEVVTGWAPSQPWCPPAVAALDVIGSYRFDDPEGRVGMETHLVAAGDVVLQVPLTYRDEPLDGPGASGFITEMQHSALGTRWVYDGLADPLYVRMLAAVAMTGQGEALGFAHYEDRWYVVPSNVRIHGGGWTQERAAVDGFEPVADEDPAAPTFGNDRFELTVFRRPVAGERPPIGLTAAWNGRPAVVLAQVRER